MNAFGLGPNHTLLTNSDDLNDIVTFGIYKHTSASIPSNSPLNENGILVVKQGEPDTLIHQEWTSLDDERKYIRNFDGSLWSTWYEISFPENKYIFRNEFGINDPTVLDDTDDLNDIISFGYYAHTNLSIPANTPLSEGGFLFVRQGTTNGQLLQQWNSKDNTFSSKSYYRVRNAGEVWSEWLLNLTDRPRYVDNFHSTLTNGLFYWDNSTTNAPNTSTGAALKLNSDQTNSSPYGWIAFDMAGNEPRLYVKSTDSNELNQGSWQEIYHTGNLDEPVTEIQTKDTNFDFYNEYNVPLTNPSSATLSDTYCVILLFPVTPNGLNQCIGNFKLRNINTATTANSAFLNVNVISSDNNITAQYNVSENELFDSFRLVTFTYNTVDYIGIDFRSSNGHVMENRYFTGMYNTQDTEELQVIPYYNFNTTTAINSEINSSITDYTPSANKQIVFSSDGYFKGKRGVVISAGDTSERMSNPPTATLRFNTDLGEFEYFDGSNWVAFSAPVEDAELLAALAFVSA